MWYSLTVFYGNINVVIKKQLNEEIRRIFILKVTIYDTEYFLVNIYNVNAVQDRLEILQNLPNLLENFDNIYNKTVILACDFNLFFNKKLECKGEKPIIKKEPVSHISHICDIWRIRNPRKIAYSSQAVLKKQF